MYAGVVVAYNPEKEEILKNIETYVSPYFQSCYLDPLSKAKNAPHELPFLPQQEFSYLKY